MPEVVKLDLLKLDGGINQGIPATHINDNEAQASENFFAWPGQLSSRRGNSLIAFSNEGEVITGIFTYKTALGEWVLLAMGTSRLYRANISVPGSALIEIQPFFGSPFPTSFEIASMVQYKDTVYLVKKGIPNLQRTDSFSVAPAGIEKPTLAATLAEGAAGALPAGKYIGVVTFVNDRTGAESDFSPESNELTLAADKKINWSNIPISTNYQVNQRNLYRTVKDGRGQFFHVATINNNVDTAFTEEVTDKLLGSVASLENGEPPLTPTRAAIWKERLWLTDGRDLFFSRFGFPESFSSDNIIAVFPDDGSDIRGLLPLGTALLVGKSNAIHYITGSDRDDFELSTLSDKHGVKSGASFASVRNTAFWFGGDDFYMTDGSSVRGIGSPKVRDLLEAIPEEWYQRVAGFTVPEKRWYVASIPIPDSAPGVTSEGLEGHPTHELVFNYELGTWDVFRRFGQGIPGPALNFWLGFHNGGQFLSSGGGLVIYGGYANEIQQWHLLPTDKGTDGGTVSQPGFQVISKWRSKEFGLDRHGLHKALLEMEILTNAVDDNLTISLYLDEGVTPHHTVTLPMFRGGWQRVGLNNLRRLANTFSIEFTYSGSKELVISGLTMLVSLHRRTLRRVNQ